MTEHEVAPDDLGVVTRNQATNWVPHEWMVPVNLFMNRNWATNLATILGSKHPPTGGAR